MANGNTNNGFCLIRKGQEIKDSCIAVEGWASALTFTTSKDGKPYAVMDVRSKLYEGDVKYAFGEEYLNEYGSVDFCVEFFGKQCEFLKKYPPQEQRFCIVGMTQLSKSEKTGKDGVTRRYITGISNGNVVRWGNGEKDPKPMKIFDYIETKADEPAKAVAPAKAAEPAEQIVDFSEENLDELPF